MTDHYRPCVLRPEFVESLRGPVAAKRYVDELIAHIGDIDVLPYGPGVWVH